MAAAKTSVNCHQVSSVDCCLLKGSSPGETGVERVVSVIDCLVVVVADCCLIANVVAVAVEVQECRNGRRSCSLEKVAMLAA